VAKKQQSLEATIATDPNFGAEKFCASANP
jgi:hypothetical protein